MKKGFTLIELLVVVLIIGILAAIALPQYTKAVERSRSAEAMQVLGDLATAQSIYYMTNNSFASEANIKTGDITFGDNLSTSSYTITVPTPAATDSSITMTAARKGGMYSTGKLFLTVYNDGTIVKCTTDTEGFKTIVSAGGYTKTAAAAANCTK